MINGLFTTIVSEKVREKIKIANFNLGNIFPVSEEYDAMYVVRRDGHRVLRAPAKSEVEIRQLLMQLVSIPDPNL